MIDCIRGGKTAGGYIVNISSVSAYTASINRGDYCMSKAAMSMMTWLYADRLADERISVFEVAPGIISTDMTGPVREKYEKLIAERSHSYSPLGRTRRRGSRRGSYRQRLIPIQHRRSDQRGRWISYAAIVNMHGECRFCQSQSRLLPAWRSKSKQSLFQTQWAFLSK